MQRESISVVVPTFNRPSYLVEAVASVLAQTIPAAELIVVDDGSTEDCSDCLAPFRDRVTYLRQANAGIGAARNTGVARATGDFLAFLDDDDLWLPEKLACQLAAFRQRSELDVVYGHAEHFLSPDADDATREQLGRIAGKVLPTPLPSAMLIRRAAFERVGPFDPTLQLGVDMDWFARLSERGLVTEMLDAIVYRRRLHATNINRTQRHDQPERLLVLKRVIDRRRAHSRACPAE